MTSVRWLRGLEEIDRNRSVLVGLAHQTGRQLPFAHPDFLRAYVSHFEYSTEPPQAEVLLAEEAGKPIGFLATRVSRATVWSRLRTAERSLLVTHDHDRFNLVASPQNERAAARGIVAELLSHPCASALDIAGLVVGSPLHAELHAQARRAPTWSVFDIALPPFSTVPVTYASLADYFGSLSKTMRSNVSRQGRRLFAAGEVELLTARGANEVSPLFPAFLDVERRSWKYSAQAGVLRSPRRTAFFRDVAEGRTSYEPILVGVVLDGVLIATLLLGRYGNEMWALEMSFDDQYGSLGAGHLLLLLAMREAIHHGVVAVGFLQHFAYFKRRWLATEVPVVSTRVVRVGSPLHVRHVGGNLLRRAATKVGRSPGDADSDDDVVSFAPSKSSARPHTSPIPRDDAASRSLLRNGSRPALFMNAARAAEILPFLVK